MLTFLQASKKVHEYRHSLPTEMSIHCQPKWAFIATPSFVLFLFFLRQLNVFFWLVWITPGLQFIVFWKSCNQIFKIKYQIKMEPLWLIFQYERKEFWMELKSCKRRNKFVTWNELIYAVFLDSWRLWQKFLTKTDQLKQKYIELTDIPKTKFEK